MLVYLADEASPVVSRYKDTPKDFVDFPIRLLLTCTGSVRSRARIMAKACDALGPTDLFVDSGAFILRSSFYKTGRLPSPADARTIVCNHLGACKWLVDHGYPIKAVAELDVPGLYDDVSMIYAWRDELMFPFQEETGVPIVFGLHHGVESTSAFENLVTDPRVKYLGMSAAITRQSMADAAGSVEGYYKYMAMVADYCYTVGIKFHGYAVTRVNLLRRIPYYSCDSVSWQQALHFGGAMTFDAKSGNLIRIKAGKTLVRDKGAKALAKNVLKLRSHGSNLKPLDVIGRTKVKGRLRADHLAIFKDQAKVFVDMETYFTEYWRLKGFDWSKQLAKVGR